ncbi:MAG: hypothetical protein IKG37_03735, partial [Solobacterium sp.]|nr:hypothetical protein [Solobacterium sp.]
TTNPWYDASVPVNNSRENIHYNVRWLLALGNDKKPAGYDTNPNVETYVLDTDKGSNLKRVDNYIVEETNYGLYEGVFEYPAFTDSTRDSSGTFFYSDGYFFKDSHTYNEHLATMSFALALAAGYSNKGNDGASDHRYDPDTGPYYPIKTANIIKLLEDIGVKSDDIFINEWNTKAPTTESMGVTIGSKTLADGKKLVILGTRGTGYGAEWASNVTLGNEPDSEAAGFSHGADIAFQNLEDYLTAHTINGNSENTVFWLSGFSRAGAVANLTAKRIIDKYNHDGSRVYAYPMEAPRGGRDSQKIAGNDYSSIHNIINAADVVPYVAPVEMGFVRYGVDHYVPGTAAGEVKTTPHEIKYQTPNGEVTLTATEYVDNEPSNGDQAQIQEMVKQLRAVNPDVIYDDYFYEATLSFLGNYIYTENISSMIQELASSSLTAPQFIANFFQDFQSKGFNYTIGNHSGDYRYFYAEEIMRPDTSFQNAAAELCGIFFNLSNSDANALMEVLGNVMYRINLTSVYMDIFRSGDDSWTTYSSYDAIGKGKVDAMADELWNAIATRDEERGFPSIYDVIDQDLADRIHAVWKPLIFPLVYFAHRDYKETDSNVLGSLAYNASRLLMNHNQDVVYSYLRANDGYYKDGNHKSYKRCLISNEIITNIELGIRVTKYQGDTPTTEEHWQSEGNFGIIVLEDERDKVELITKNPDSITSIFYSYEGNPESRTYRYS